MSKFLKGLKSLFVEEVKTPAKKGGKTTKAAPETTKKTAGKTTESTPTVPATPRPAGGKVNEKFVNILLGAMEKNNLEGLDYLEFKQSLKALNDMPMDEETRFKSAFAMASSMGVTPKKLVDTARHYMRVLESEEKQFDNALAGQNQKKVGAQQEEVKGLEAALKERATQIQKLTKEMDDIKKSIDAKRNKIDAATVKIRQTKEDFHVTYDVIQAQIQADIEKMKKYLGAKDAGK